MTRLLKKDLFSFVSSPDIPSYAQIFYSRFLSKINRSGTDKASEKSRVVRPANEDQKKHLILFLSQIIPRDVQRIIGCITAILEDINNIQLDLQNVTQAYVQLTSILNGEFYIRLPLELILLLVALSNRVVKVPKHL